MILFLKNNIRRGDNKDVIAHVAKQSIVFLLFFLSGCVGPDYTRPHIAVPTTWKNQGNMSSQDSQAVNTAWWHHFHDPVLEGLIQEASQNNLDYQTACARIREARANLSGVEAAFFPTLNGVGSATRSFSGTGVPKGAGASAPSGTQQSLYTAGFDATWEIDIFGGVRRGQESAVAALQSVVESAHSVFLSLAAEIAQNYINFRNYQQQIQVLKEIASLWQENLNLESKLENAGLNSHITTSTAQSSLDQALAAIPPLEANIKASLHRLGVLLGKNPGALYDELLQTTGDIPQTSEAVIAGLPSDLITRRPDVRANERALASATAQIGVAEASLFPHFQLTGSFEFDQNNTTKLFRASSQFWMYGLNFSVPIFDFCKIRAQIDAKYAQRDEAFLTYKQSILIALEEVENGLVRYATESNRYHQLLNQVKAQEQASSLTTSRYEAGLANYLDVIQAKITLLTIKMTEMQSKANVSLNLVSLYKALGGGWSGNR